MSVVKVMITAPRGKMGRLIVREASRREGLQITGALGSPSCSYSGKDLGLVAGCAEPLGISVTDNIADSLKSCDVVLDYSLRKATLALLPEAAKAGKAVLVGTTGFFEEDFKLFKEVSRKIPIMYAPCTSYAMHVLYSLLERTASLLPQADVELIEAHDRCKKDAPSGTSLEMGQVIANARNTAFRPAFGRSSGRGDALRNAGEIGYHSLRGGDTFSDHKAVFFLAGERMEISHQAFGLECYASGACDAAVYLAAQRPGQYTFDDIIKEQASV